MKRTNIEKKTSFWEWFLALLLGLWVSAVGLIILLLPFATLAFIVWLVMEAVK